MDIDFPLCRTAGTFLWSKPSTQILTCKFEISLTDSGMELKAPGHFHFKLEKKFPQGAKKKYPCIEIMYDFFCHKYSKLHWKNVGIDLNLIL